MKRRIHTFNTYLNEQEKTSNADLLGGLNAGEMAKGMLAMALDQFGIKDNNYSRIAETPETKGGKPYTACGNSPYAFKPTEGTNQDVINLFKEPNGVFSKDAKYAEIHKLLADDKNKKVFLVGVREQLDIRLKEGDKFIDKLIVVDPNAPTEKVVSYQITTCPSVAYYGDPKRTLNKDGVAIMQPGVTKYSVGTHRKGEPGQHEALVQTGETDIDRFKVGSTELDTYTPGNETKGLFGLNIHRSSQEIGVCVGPWSAGCQVFASGSDFATFMSKMKSLTANGNVFLYALVENDALISNTPTVSSEESDKEGDKEAESDKSAEFESTADSIYAELDKFNSDEDKLIDMYNSVVSDKSDASKMASAYMKKFNKDIIDDLDKALSGSELKKLNGYQ
jgi:hypothetical protein